MPRVDVDDYGREIDKRPISETPLFEAVLQGGGGSRDSDPETSALAGSKKKNAIRWGTQRAILLQVFCEAVDATDEEAGIIAGLHRRHICYWKRCSDLRTLGLIAPTGKTRQSLAGNEVMVSAVTQAGRLLLETLSSSRGRMPIASE